MGEWVPYSRYDWDQYMDGEAHVFVQGEDFACDITSFRRNAYRVAAARNMKVQSVRFHGNSIKLTFLSKETTDV